MATQSGQKILRIGVIQNGRIIEERLLRTRESVTVGEKLNNTFVIASSDAPDSFQLFELKGGNFVLHFSDKMSGRVSVGDQVHDLASLRSTGKAAPAKGGHAIQLDDKSRGKVSIGDVTILFQFVSPPPLRVLPQLPANMRGGLLLFIASVIGLDGIFLATMLLSAVAQSAAVIYLIIMVPPPPRSSGLAEIPDRFIEIMRPQEEPPEPEDPEPSDDAEPAEDGLAEAEEPEPEPERAEPQEREEPASDSQQEQRSEDVIREQARERVRQESALGAVMQATDDGAGGPLAFVTERSTRRAEDIIAGQEALGGDGEGGGIVSSEGLGTSEGAEGDVRRAEIDGGGRSQVAEEATVEREEEARTVEVRARVRGSDPRSAGSGRLDEDSIASVLRRGERDVTRCYERGLARDPGLGGRIVLQITIGTDGRVSEARLRDNDLDDGVGSCITGYARRWRFDEPEGGTVTVQKAYILESGS